MNKNTICITNLLKHTRIYSLWKKP